MRERPILFSGPMVRAILAGHKTQTRRVAKEFAGRDDLDAVLTRFPNQSGCPYGAPGDRLWVRESTHRRPMLNLLTGEPLADKYDGGAYTADGADVLTPEGFDLAWWYSRKSCPSIHMPRFACRLVLEVTSVRVERLNEISQEDAELEGVECNMSPLSFREHFQRLWEHLNGAESWDANPWVWVVEFRRAEDGGAHG
ncbi:hypothetical protein [Achromobacter sp. 2789STDY5608628]|uniref:hypothetical protein n=1 Tax=Achromobacter sp. 2789STDY5608628 TaxID=1806493 RepID=UPI0006C53C3B|nr:hypothetical protein [Achromobacter sp. 2789STDY5608628]CUJ36478.1 Uncharacterised protein [Achromobacter sp. 2789STDY5608628]